MMGIAWWHCFQLLTLQKALSFVLTSMVTLPASWMASTITHRKLTSIPKFYFLPFVCILLPTLSCWLLCQYSLSYWNLVQGWEKEAEPKMCKIRCQWWESGFTDCKQRHTKRGAIVLWLQWIWERISNWAFCLAHFKLFNTHSPSP